MPFRSARHCRHKIILSLLVAVQLSGCATTDRASESAPDEEQAAAEIAELFEGLSTPSTPGEAAPVAEAGDETGDALDEIAKTPASPKPVLPKPGVRGEMRVFDWRVIEGAPVGNFFTGVTTRHFTRPVAVAVQGESLYVVDAGANALYRYDLTSRRMDHLLDMKAEVSGEVEDIYVDKDLSFYLTDTDAGRVVHYDRHGRVLREFRDHFNMVRPVAVTVLDNGDLVVADGHYDHLLRFNSQGKLTAVYGGRGQGVAEFLNVMTMAKGPDGYYVGSRVGRRLQVLGDRGDYLYAFEAGAAVFPAAVAVDRNNRSYVADYMDNTIKVFDRGAFMGTIGRFGTGQGQFKRITDLWLDGNRLYVVDSLNGRVQVAQLSPDRPSLPRPGPAAQPVTSPEATAPSPEEAVDQTAEQALETAPPADSPP